MDQSWKLRFAAVILFLGLAIYYSLPSIFYFSLDPETRRAQEEAQEQARKTGKKLPQGLADYLPSNRVNLGIDLQGGLHLVMGVDTEKAIQDAADRQADAIFDIMKEKGKPLERARREGEAPEVTLVMTSDDHGSTLNEVLDDWYDWDVLYRSGRTVLIGLDPEVQEIIREEAVDQTLLTLRKRIDELGVKEPQIRRRGDSSILIQLAGVREADKQRVKDDVIGKTAQLEFKIVDETNQYFSEIASAEGKPDEIELLFDNAASESRAATNRPYLVSADREVLKTFIRAHRNKLPRDREVGIGQAREPGPDGKPRFITYLLDRKPGITGDFLETAAATLDPEDNSWQVTMRFDKKGAVIFENLTRKNVGRLMAIVLDGQVDSAPVIQGPIPGGNARITLGGRTREEARQEAKSLALVLKAGALPAPVTVEEERTVGATLGDDAVAKGKTALLVAIATVLVVMLVYYRLTGAVGVVALMVNMLFLFAALAIIGITLTLPGIAGLALTVGMAVDANIIQFERIREELRAGKSVQAAVSAGFEKAFSAILDANVTTFLACLVLGQFGTGPIRGFAVTLGIGVVINTITAVVVPRLGLDYFTRGLRVKALSI